MPRPFNETTRTQVFDAAILGAGIAGLSARKTLNNKGLRTITLEKSRGSAGRMATRRGEQWVADLGAQFTAASDPRWQEVVHAQAEDLITLNIQDDSKYPRFAHRQGMSAFARALLLMGGPPEDVRFQSKVVALSTEPGQSYWTLVLDSGEKISAASVVLTAPVPQALELLQNSKLTLSDKNLKELAKLKYHPCIALIAELSSPLPDRLPVIWKNPSSKKPAGKLAGIFDQKRKGLISDRPTVVLHGSASASLELWESDPSQQTEALLADFHAILKTHGAPAEVVGSTLHRWRYCEPEKIYPEPFLKLDLLESQLNHPALFIAGDAFGRSSVEGAFLSGAAAGAAAGAFGAELVLI